MVTVINEVLKPVVVLVLSLPFGFVITHDQVYIAGNVREEGNIDGKRLPS
jgi:hypothetical protein